MFGDACLWWVKLVSPWELGGTPSSTDWDWEHKSINLLPFLVAMNQLSGLSSGFEDLHKWLLESFVPPEIACGSTWKKAGVFLAEIRFAGHYDFKYGDGCYVIFRYVSPRIFLQKESTLYFKCVWEAQTHRYLRAGSHGCFGVGERILLCCFVLPNPSRSN